MSNKMTIPEIRDRLKELTEKHKIPELSDLADQMYREQYGNRAPIQNDKFTEDTAEKIRNYKKDNPTAQHQDIAEVFNVNIGRVSEALSGKK